MISPFIRTDDNRVKQFLLGLLANSLKFTQKGGVTIKVRIIKDDSEFLEIEVEDTGIGIKEEDHNKLFKLFGFLQSPD